MKPAGTSYRAEHRPEPVSGQRCQQPSALEAELSESLDAKAWLAGMQTKLDTSACRPSPSSAPPDGSH
ncbi:hypothetical protein B7R77_14025 [Ralstonia solanacearum K60]|uniref:Uncharacterized protein n=1 Tax=Ralstonia solanacearum K60 TaxID=1091042 RepID=A0AAP8D506_RALSL|nr:hypothetical protein B7R77_14025 [Ralstonia solanacearum K60]CCF98645.1 conserved hypothetical protein [Ralstonia solanacearum K60]